MLIPTYCRLSKSSYINLNTSNVNVNRQAHTCYISYLSHLNTSNVNVNQVTLELIENKGSYLNTSNVNVNQTWIRMWSFDTFRFKYI